MATVEGNVEALAEAILSEAREEAEQIAARARADAELVRQRAREAAAREKQVILDDATQQARRLRGQGTATAQMKSRSMELEHREQLLAKVFESVADRLKSVTRRKDYPEIAEQLVRESLSQLMASAAELHMDEVTQGVVGKTVLDKVSREMGVQLSVGEPLKSGTGVIARTEDGRLQFDNTLETRLARMQGTLRASVYRILLGEAQ